MSSFVDSKHKKVSLKEIFKIAAKETGGKYTADQIEASVGTELYKARGLAVREGNTLFIVHAIPEQPTVAVFRAINADVIKNYLQNSVDFAKAVGLMGYKYMVTTFDDKKLLNIFHYIGRKAPFGNMGFAIEELKGGRYRVTVNLGDITKGSKK
jgi:hypothetical protein